MHYHNKYHPKVIFVSAIVFVVLSFISFYSSAQFSVFQKIGSDYRRTIEAGNQFGHIFFYCEKMGIRTSSSNIQTTCDICVKHNGLVLYEFRIVPDRYTNYAYDVVPLRGLESNYDVEIVIKGNIGSVRSEKKFSFVVNAEQNVVHGIYASVAGDRLGFSSNYKEERFINQIADEILNPTYIEYNWIDLVKRNKSTENLTSTRSGKTNTTGEVESIAKRLERIDKLLKDGHISQEEHQQLRLQIIKDL